MSYKIRIKPDRREGIKYLALFIYHESKSPLWCSPELHIGYIDIEYMQNNLI